MPLVPTEDQKLQLSVSMVCVLYCSNKEPVCVLFLTHRSSVSDLSLCLLVCCSAYLSVCLSACPCQRHATNPVTNQLSNKQSGCDIYCLMKPGFLSVRSLLPLGLFRDPFLYYHPHWHVKDPGHSAKSAGGRLHLNTHTPLTQPSQSGPLSRHSVGTLSGNELTRSSSGNTRSQSSQLAEPLWTDPDVKNGITVRELIST